MKKTSATKLLVCALIPLGLMVGGVKMVQDYKTQKAEAATKKLADFGIREPGIKPASIEELIEQGADVNNGSHANATPLHYAAQCGAPVIKVLLDHGAKVNAQDMFGTTPLVCAVQVSDLEGVRLLLSRGADPNLHTPVPTDSPSYGTPLYYARQTLQQRQKKHSAKQAAALEIIRILDASGAK